MWKISYTLLTPIFLICGRSYNCITAYLGISLFYIKNKKINGEKCCQEKTTKKSIGLT